MANAVTMLEIHDAPGLDMIDVYFKDLTPGGHVTITCYGSAWAKPLYFKRQWTAYFGAMNGKTIREFVACADVDYLTRHLKGRKCDMEYLAKIVAAVKSKLADSPEVPR